MNRIRQAALLAGILCVGLLAGCAAEPAPVPAATVASTPSPTPTFTPVAATTVVGQVATVIDASITPLDAPDGAAVAEFANPTRPGVPLVFLVEEKDGDWLRVSLPMRPNGSSGWIRADAVALNSLTYELEISTADHSVALIENGEEIARYDAAIGTGDTPTPTGDYFITELLQPTNSGYGPYAFGISAFSDVLNDFGGGVGQIGLHGTDDSGSIGQAVSHGCVRLHNEDITYLAGILPLGTPVHIS